MHKLVIAFVINKQVLFKQICLIDHKTNFIYDFLFRVSCKKNIMIKQNILCYADNINLIGNGNF